MMKGQITGNRQQSAFSAYGLAVLAMLLASLLAWLIQFYVPKGNLSLVYIVAVIVTAVNVGTRPAILCALLGFLAINFMFTEPRGTFRMIHREDIVTAVWFLLVAILVGHLAAKLQEKLQILVGKDRFSVVEMRFLEQLSQSMHEQDILAALSTAVREYLGCECKVLALDESQAGLGTGTIFPISDTDKTIAWLSLALSDDRQPLSLADQDSLNILLRQTGIALTRARVAADLASEKLERERELLRTALLSSVSHDFRTPLTAMVGATSTLIELGDDISREERIELLDSVLSEAKRLDGYAQNLLDMTRIGRGDLTLDRSWVSVEEIIHVSAKRLRPHLVNQQLEISLAPDLPLLWVHPALLEQALFNVLHNASKFAPENTTISLHCQVRENTLVLEIADQGRGIPLAEREKVFEMFHTAEQGDRRRAGSGLGLAISKGMIAAHGGTIEIADAPGCLVRISLPIEENPAMADSAKEEDEP